MARLTSKQKQIITAITTPQELTMRQVASMAEVTERTLRETLRFLSGQDCLNRSCFINYGRLGLHTFNMFFSLSHKRAKQALTYLARDPHVVG
jgi:transcription initiation factor TFIIIB Brf1 subunit/transcription initiation factor TFIIB